MTKKARTRSDTMRESAFQVRQVMSSRRSKVIAISIAFVYLMLYFAITGLYSFYPGEAGFSIHILENWPALIFRERAPYNWEPIGIISIGGLDIFLSVPNIILGFVIGLLVGVNIAVSVYTYTHRTLCRIDPSRSMLSAVPALLTGFACCGPTLLISLGIASASITIAFVTILPLFLPMALIGLVASLLWSGWKLASGKPEDSQSEDEKVTLTLDIH
ncbi:MAG: hypothetical protein RTU30_05500 [Candidatus Thorarchaeota archaeon]